MNGPNIATLARPETLQPVSIAAMTAPAPAVPTSEQPELTTPPAKSASSRIEALLSDVQTKIQELHGPGFATVVASSVVQILLSEGRLKALVEQVMTEMIRDQAQAALPAEIPVSAQPAAHPDHHDHHDTPSNLPDVPVEADPSLVFLDVANPKNVPYESLIVFSPTIGADLSPASIDVSTWSVDDHGDTQPVTLKPSYHAAVLAHYRNNASQYGFGQHYILQMGTRRTA